MPEIVMPQLSDSMEQGLVLQWLIADGAEVSAGDELVEIETDKATMTYEAEVAGTPQILVAEGTTVAVGEPICTIGEPAEGGSGPAVRERAEELVVAPDGAANGNGHVEVSDEIAA